MVFKTLLWAGLSMGAFPVMGYAPFVLQSNEFDMYLNPGELAIQSITALPGSLGVRVTLASNLPGLQNDPNLLLVPYGLTYEVNGAFSKAAPGTLAPGPSPLTATLDIPFDDYRGTRLGVSAEATLTLGGTDYSVTFNYYSHAFYHANSCATPDTIVLRQADDPDRVPVPLESSLPQDWMVDQPAAADVLQAEALWGKLVSPFATPTVNAQAIAESIIDHLEAHRGIPSDAMNRLPPFTQYLDAINNIPPDPDAPSNPPLVYCSNIAAIFAHACNCLGIPARIFSVGGDLTACGDLGDGTPLFDLVRAEGHASTEIFDSTRNRWVWIDPTLYILEMDLDAAAGNDPVGVVELAQCLDNPSVRTTLSAKVYVPTEPVFPHLAGAGPGSLNTVPFPSLSALASANNENYDVLRFFGAGATLSTVRSTPSGTAATAYASNEFLLFSRPQALAFTGFQPPAAAGVMGADIGMTFNNQVAAGIEYELIYDSTPNPPAPLYTWQPLDPSTQVLSTVFPQGQNQSQARLYAFRTVDPAGNPVAQFDPLEVMLVPAAVYSDAGQAGPGQVVIMPRHGIPNAAPAVVADWITDLPSPQDKAYASRIWGALVRGSATPTANAQAIAMAIMTALDHRLGIPENGVDALPPFLRYARAVAGESRLEETDVDAIFAHACNCLGIPARVWGLGGDVVSEPSGFQLMQMEPAATAEIFDARAGRWVWMDPGFGVLGAQYADYGWTDLAGFTHALNFPGKSSRLMLETFQPGAEPVTQVLGDTDQAYTIRRFFGPQETYRVWAR